MIAQYEPYKVTNTKSIISCLLSIILKKPNISYFRFTLIN